MGSDVQGVKAEIPGFNGKAENLWETLSAKNFKGPFGAIYQDLEL